MGLCGGDKLCAVAQLWEVQPVWWGCCGSVSSPTKCSLQINSSVTG